jgi:hypothetical protein
VRRRARNFVEALLSAGEGGHQLDARQGDWPRRHGRAGGRTGRQPSNNGRRGAAVYIRPDTDGLRPGIARSASEDPLLRDAIVYLTCLHELGHALGLPHTAAYADVMYSFGYGGDIAAFFGRSRERLSTRGDIANVSGLSADDVARLRALYPTY